VKIITKMKKIRQVSAEIFCLLSVFFLDSGFDGLSWYGNSRIKIAYEENCPQAAFWCGLLRCSAVTKTMFVPK